MDKLAPLKYGFDSQPVVVQISALRSTRPLPHNALSTKKFLQILASVATVGLIEPVIVTRDAVDSNIYRILDGRLRVEALRRLSRTDATCLIASDDEAYTYNKHVNKLTPAQDARMIARAIARGVESERIATVLGIDINTVRRRANLLEGICGEAATLLADKNCPATTFSTLKQMKPLRQMEAAELMCGQGNFTSAFATAILAATPHDQLSSAVHAEKSQSELAMQLAKLERELATLQANVAETDEQYGIEHLHLAVSAAYIATLLGNKSVAGYIESHHPEFARELSEITRDSVEFTTRPIATRRRDRGSTTGAEGGGMPVQM
ncbi:plasmid partitioning protein RepB C-terminal domain-containing protein [Paraburkholderia flagellata]|uniref:plasmid partitioning protein RepB C-terminal domain-containing protein n=1 Tax=Paraburkholderia flagellata TaxID=2883241 RepID=UPI001F28B3A5|nr:plasmid partitioning protein RepB C-terminal domain-containing protein [Paraburkholderia flagellata]